MPKATEDRRQMGLLVPSEPEVALCLGSGLVEETPLGAWSDVRTLRLYWNWGRRTRRTWHYDSARPWSTGPAAAGRAQASRVATRAPSLWNWYLGFTGSLL